MKYLFISFLACMLCCCGEKKQPSTSSEKKQEETTTNSPSAENLNASLKGHPKPNAISSRCMECHKEIHHHWQKSHHGQANRLLDMTMDSAPFANKSLQTPSEKWTFSKDTKELTITANGEKHEVGMVIGVEPLIQYLTAASDGRWQSPNAAWDPSKKEWFDIFNGDARTKADWGHWTNRGMTWNTQCAWCHMTDYRKNYDEETDSYKSHWKEMGIGCTQCHGNLAEHADEKSGCLIDMAAHKDLKKNHPNGVLENCATCHSRRAEFDDKFHIGDKFGDHYQLQLPTLPNLYYPDGQIRDEVYVWTSLRTSNMGHKGVGCMDCHDPHTTKLKLPLTNNALCMSCHSGGSNGRISGATIIDPSTHTHHFGIGKHNDVGSGHSCVDCHMTHTTYMGRDPRRDHGFHVPDPALTKELGIPNACNKCHTEKDVDWAAKWTKDWYGEKMHSPERKRQRARTRAIANAYTGDPRSIDKLLEAHKNEQNPYWQATLLQIMQPWANDPRVQHLGRAGVHSKESIVRASACMLLEFSSENGPWLEPMLKDPVKEVRMAASWAWRRNISSRSDVYKKLADTIRFGADQPAGALRLAQLANDANDLEKAEEWAKRAMELDKTSPGTHEFYAILLGRMERPKEALTQLETARKLAPQNARYPYLMALTYAELNQKDKTEELLRVSLKLDANNPRAWYNLGLLLAGQNKLNEAINCIRNAEQLDQNNADYPYARATLHLRKGQKMEAFEACRTVLGIDRNHRNAMQLLRQIGNPQQK
ncbi:MAG: tetratricopeptide repeat protein [Akkermansiaceae bacterium]